MKQPIKISILIFISITTLILSIFPAVPAFSQSDASDIPFEKWLNEVQQDIVKKGILSDKKAKDVFSHITWQPTVVDLDRRQPERRLSTATYLQKTISRQRISEGRKFLHEKKALIEKIQYKYQVPGRFVIALWAMETSFGRNTGGYDVLDALATLAHDGRRADFFRKEFEVALKILAETGMAPDKITGSWAGAMGQCQFMPSTFLNYAVDFDGDGRRDIWNNRADVLGSAAHYLQQIGWDFHRGWGRQVQIPTTLATNLVGMETVLSLKEWQEKGVRQTDGLPLPPAAIKASLIQPDGPGTPAYLVYDNFRVLLKWNRSVPFALSVGLLADHIGKK
jgi:membrane-bound lytic murein transglycosylase B